MRWQNTYLDENQSFKIPLLRRIGRIRRPVVSREFEVYNPRGKEKWLYTLNRAGRSTNSDKRGRRRNRRARQRLRPSNSGGPDPVGVAPIVDTRSISLERAAVLAASNSPCLAF